MAWVLSRRAPSVVGWLHHHGLILPSSGRAHGWKPDTPDAKDWTLRKLLGPRPMAPIEGVVELDPKVVAKVSTEDQGPLGSCTGQGVSGCLEYNIRVRPELADVELSPLFAYYRGRVEENSIPYDVGCEIRDVVKRAAIDGVALESTWPYIVEKFARNPTKAAYASAQRHRIAVGYYRCDSADQTYQGRLDNILRAIQAGIPVTGGFSCYSNLDRGPRPGVIPLPGPRDELEGGHCVWFTRADIRERLLKFRNSWGEWGDRGNGYLSFEYVLRGLADDFWAIAHA